MAFKQTVSMIVAADQNNGIGFQNQLLCHLPDDLKYFKKLTTGAVVIMGRKTFESIGRPLPNRRNMVLSRSNFQAEGVAVFDSIENALNVLSSDNNLPVFIIGGAQLYQQYIQMVDTIYLTRIHASFEADAWFPQLSENTWKCIASETHEVDEKHNYPFSFETYQRIKN